MVALPPEKKALIRRLYREYGKKRGTWTRIAKELGLHRNTVMNVIKEIESNAPADDATAPTPPPQPKSDMEKTYARIRQFFGSGANGVDIGDSEIGRAVATLLEHERALQEAKRTLGRLTGGRGTGTLDAGAIEQYQEAVRAAEEAAKSTLEKLGYKVMPADKPSSEAEAIEYLKARGYHIEEPHITREQLQKILEEEREKMRQEFDAELQKSVEERKIKAAETLVERAIDRVFDIFVKPLQRALGYEVEERKGGGGAIEAEVVG